MNWKAIGHWFWNAFAILFGLTFLWIPCLLHAWEPVMSTNGSTDQTAPRQIDQWSWKWLRPWYHNPADGDSGKFAIIDWTHQTYYMPDGDKPKWLPQWLWESLRAYLWSAWRNSADGLKYIFGEGDKAL